MNSENRTVITLTSTTSSYLREEEYDWEALKVLSEPIVGLDKNIEDSVDPKIAVEGNKIYTVWWDYNNTNNAGIDGDIFLKYFDGNKWSKVQVVSEPVPGKNYDVDFSGFPAIAVENDKIYVVWWSTNNTNGAGTDYDIFYRYFNGNSWSQIQVISEPVPGKNYNTRFSYDPAIAVENGNIYVVWYDGNETNGAGTDGDIFFRCNLGKGWEDVQVISEPASGKNFNSVYSYDPDIAVENSKIYVVWRDKNNTYNAGSDWDIFFKCNLTGTHWERVEVISEPSPGWNVNTGDSDYPDIAVENGKIYVVWYDCDNTNGAGGHDNDIFFRCNLNGFSWEDMQVISEPIPGEDFNEGESYDPAIVVENSKIYVIWHDSNNTNGAGDAEFDIFYKCNLTGYYWEEVQIISEPIAGNNINTGNSTFSDIAINLGKSYIVWTDENNTNGAGTDYDIFFKCTTHLPPVLFFPNVTPTSSNTSTYFNFTVIYFDVENDAPTEVTLKIDSINCSMIETDASDINYLDGKNYYYNTTLDIGDNHTYQFWASDGNHISFTDIYNEPYVYNTPPKIITEDNLTAIEDTYYNVNYGYEDIDLANVGQIGDWSLETNATWLKVNTTSGILNGTPSNDDVGKCWVNISINDTIDVDFTNFTLTVIDINDNPIICTSNIEITYEDAVYYNDYNATDVDSLIEKQIWSLKTNASSWLDIDFDSGALSGTPTNDEVGSYWINVTVDDGENGLDSVNFTISVINVNDQPIITTEDILIAQIDLLYEADYNAIDIDSPLSQHVWSLETNATWLRISSDTGILSGTPAFEDLGWYNINVTVDDGDGSQNWHEFILIVIKGNEPPEITTIDLISITFNEIYYIDYEAIDDYTPPDQLLWSLETNASWLRIGANTGILRGTPKLSDVGWYWVNVSVDDSDGGFDYHYFTLIVYSTANHPPEIISTAKKFASVDVLYYSYFEAIDDRTSANYLQWYSNTNASWLNFISSQNRLSGIPKTVDVGSYWVNISVSDGEGGWDYQNFTLYVSMDPIEENSAPELFNNKIIPAEGNTNTEFTFSIDYYHPDDKVPAFIQLIIDSEIFNMELEPGENANNGTYSLKLKLSKGTHIYYFVASDGKKSVRTDDFITPQIKDSEDKHSQNELSWIWLTLIGIIILIIIVILIFLNIRKQKVQKEDIVQANQPPRAQLKSRAMIEDKIISAQHLEGTLDTTVTLKKIHPPQPELTSDVTSQPTLLNTKIPTGYLPSATSSEKTQPETEISEEVEDTNE